MDLRTRLAERDSAGTQIRVAVVGAGQMGEGLVCQMEGMRGMSATIVADTQPGRAEMALKSAGVDSADIVSTNDPAKASEALANRKRVACTTSAAALECDSVDVVVESTGVPAVGAEVAFKAILNRRHIVQMNVETDATVGYILRRMARAAGVVYTLTIGDEPGAAMELYDFAVSLGFKVVSAGKGKNNPLDRAATPESVAVQAEKQMMNPKMLASFVDGTKTMVEMTSLANATGFVPDIRGMHGPQVTPKTIANRFIPKSEGGVLNFKDVPTGVVEYGIGIAPGVFVVITTTQPKIARDLRYLRLGEGPYWALYRPYHLANIETPISIARAALDGTTTIATDSPPTAETITVAKRALNAGEHIDGLGGYTVYGLIERADIAKREKLLPLGLAPGCRIRRDVKLGVPLTYDDVEMDTSQLIWQLRQMQDALDGA